MVVNIVKEFTKLGLGEYEAKAYIALYEENPATAYEVAKKSHIPTSKIYEVLARLVEKELAIELVETSKKRYVPADIDDYIHSYKEQMKKASLSVKEGLDTIKSSPNTSWVVTIASYDELLKRAKNMIEKAESHVLLSLWENESCKLRSEIMACSTKMAIVHFGETELETNALYVHPAREVLYNEKGGRQFSVAVDSKEALSATIYHDGHIEAAWSRNTGFVAISEDYIKHDVYIIKVANRFRSLLQKSYGDEFEYLRNIYKDEVIQ